MSMEHCWNDTEKGKRSYVLGENPVPVGRCGDGDVGNVITDI